MQLSGLMVYDIGGLSVFKILYYRPTDCLCFSNLHKIKIFCHNITLGF